MEIKKAIVVLNAELQHTKQHIQYENKAKEYYEEMQDIIDATEMAISALEKQVGKKPVRVNKNGDFDGNFEVVCPVCGIKLMERITTNEISYPRIYNRTGYCWCGQKILWE